MIFRTALARLRSVDSRSPHSPQTFVPRIESLEERRVLSAIAITDFEQLLVELVNRDRMHPAEAVARFPELSDLNDGLPAGTISESPKQPLAPNQLLANAALEHAQDMLEFDYFSHTDLGGGSPSDRAAAAGYPTGVGENIAWAGTTGTLNQLDQVYGRHKSLFLSPGHRQNMMLETYRELGTGVSFGVYTTSPPTTNSVIDWNAIMVVENFGNPGGNSLITGVAFTDAVASDNFYDVGEGVGDVRITAVNTSTGASYYTRTGSSGGYSLPVPNGTYTVTATGGGLPHTMVTEGIDVASANVKVDFNTSIAQDLSREIIGRADDGGWWVATRDGETLSSRQWGSWASSVNWQNVTYLDFNGDGLTDVAGRANGTWWLSVSTGSSFVNRSIGSWSPSVTWTSVLGGDFNGDGMDDLVGRAANGSWWVGSSNGSSMATTYWGRWNALAWQNITAADFDGDGKDDIVGRAPDGSWWVGRSTGSAFATSSWAKWSVSANWQDIQIGDFDGDGRADILGRAGVDGSWWAGTSLGNRFLTTAWARWAAINWQNVRVGDFTGDGRDDIIGMTGGKWWLGRSTGSSFLTSSWGTALAADQILVGDHDGDGNTDLLSLLDGNWFATYSNGKSFDNFSLQHQWADIAWANMTIDEFAV